jgi:BirA family biotin operon repressor/biotin-[acetyl-CoA-carboxylase] ligase
LKQILHADYDLKALLCEICRHIEAWYLNLRAGKASFVRETYLSRLYWLNECRCFKVMDAVFNGMITGVRDNGLLVIQNNNGHELEFNLKEIEFVS